MRRTISLMACIGIVWVFCTEYNSFDNPVNVNMVIQPQSSSLYTDSINTVYIFTTETLTVAATAKEKIDSFTIRAEGNRYWEVQSIPAPVLSSNYTFLFSYPDTGQRTITLNTYRRNGDVIPLTFSLHVTSPLTQADVSGGESDTILLSTPAVGDNDVLYSWQFEGGIGSSKKIISSLPTFSYPVDIIGNGTGYLWVSDTMGNGSPVTSFLYNFFDTTGPVILCINEGLQGDTVVTGAKTFNFKIECNDGLGVSGAVINDSLNFNDSTVNIKSTLYYKIFEAMDTLFSYITKL